MLDELSGVAAKSPTDLVSVPLASLPFAFDPRAAMDYSCDTVPRVDPSGAADPEHRMHEETLEE